MSELRRFKAASVWQPGLQNTKVARSPILKKSAQAGGRRPAAIHGEPLLHTASWSFYSDG